MYYVQCESDKFASKWQDCNMIINAKLQLEIPDIDNIKETF